MSFGGFKFGSSSTAPPPAPQPASVPSFSLTGPTPAPTPQGQPQSFSFGSTAPAAPSSGGLFGAQPAAAAPNSGGLFGAKPTTTGGMFGSQSTAPSTGGMFGQPQQQPQAQQAGGMFGAQQQAQQQGGGMFGAQPPASTSTGLFGSTSQPPQQQTQQQQSSGLFGAQPSQGQGQNKPALNGSTSQASQGSGGMTKTTKFTDLPEQAQKSLEQLDQAFKQQKQLVFGTLDSQEDLGRAIRQVINDVKSAEAECTALELGLAPLRRACEQLSYKVKSEEEDLQRLADIWGSYRPTDGRPSSLRAGALREFRKQYFRKVFADSEERIPRYKKTISEIRRAVDSLQNANDLPSPQAIAQTIQNHQNAIYTLAAQVEGLEVRWNDVRAFYSQMYKDKTGSIRDPLDIARERKGLPPVRS